MSDIIVECPGGGCGGAGVVFLSVWGLVVVVVGAVVMVLLLMLFSEWLQKLTT